MAEPVPQPATETRPTHHIEIPAPAIEETPAPAPLTFVAPEAPVASEPSPVIVAREQAHTPAAQDDGLRFEQPQPARTDALSTAVTAGEPQSLGEAFGNAGKTNWSPSEIVAHLLKLPNIAGAAVALQEGLVIAHQLPEPMKGEVFAAFLPQIFARLGQYANEMKLGAVHDILIQSGNGPCHVFRRGQVFFAALGMVGEPLPTPILRLCMEALSDQ
jgi:predicted regulator of Ras-like GTPase activity (Roadblock/LC7/MglB family)